MTPVVVYDCMIYLQALAGGPRGSAFACFELVETGRVKLAMSPAVLGEVRDVLARVELRRKFSSLVPVRVEAFLSRIIRSSVWIAAPERTIALPRDPKDEKYADLAVAAGAAFLVTRDRDLLDMNSPSSVEGAALRSRSPRLAILTPEEFLAAVSRAGSA